MRWGSVALRGRLADTFLSQVLGPHKSWCACDSRAETMTWTRERKMMSDVAWLKVKPACDDVGVIAQRQER